MRVVVASDQTSEREQLRLAVTSLGLECSAGDCPTIAGLPQRLQQDDAVLALVTLGLDRIAALAAVHGAATTKTPLYAVWDGGEGDVLPALLRAGLRGYLRQSALRSDLVNAVKELRDSPGVEVKRGQLIAVMGGQPGVGVTTVATHLAFALADKHPGQVALAQLGKGVPDLALNLNLKPARSLAELAAGWYRLDVAMMAKCLVAGPANLSILADQPGTPKITEWHPAAIQHALMLLRSRFAFVVVDLGHRLDPARRAALRAADDVGVVLRLDMPAVQIARQFIHTLRDSGLPDEKLLGVVNRYGQKDQLPWKQAHTVLNIAVGDWVPDDPAHVNFALNAGKPLIETARTAAITASFAKLAERWPDARRSHSGVG